MRKFSKRFPKKCSVYNSLMIEGRTQKSNKGITTFELVSEHNRCCVSLVVIATKDVKLVETF